MCDVLMHSVAYCIRFMVKQALSWSAEWWKRFQ